VVDASLPGFPEPALVRLVVIEDLKQLKARYFRFMDTKDWTSLRGVFTDDATMDIDGFVTQGGDAIVAFMSGVLANVTTVHHGHMPEITVVEHDHATGIWPMYDYVQFPAESPDAPAQGLKGYGHYHDDYRKQHGTWRIARTHLVRLRVDPLPGGLPGQPT